MHARRAMILPLVLLAGCGGSGASQPSARDYRETQLNACVGLFNSRPRPHDQYETFLENGGISYGKRPRVRVSLETKGGVGESPTTPACVITLGYRNRPDLTVVIASVLDRQQFATALVAHPGGTEWRLGILAVRKPNARLLHDGGVALTKPAASSP
jgi:hypothetical protein